MKYKSISELNKWYRYAENRLKKRLAGESLGIRPLNKKEHDLYMQLIKNEYKKQLELIQ